MKTRTIFALLLYSVLLPLPASAFYNPQAGRWLSRDPVADGTAFVQRDRATIRGRVRSGRWIRETMNPYHFVNNNPVGRYDALGLFGNPVPPTVEFPVSTLNCPKNCGPDVTASIQSEFQSWKNYLDNAPEFPLGTDLDTLRANHAMLLFWFAQAAARLNYAAQAQAREAAMGFGRLSGWPTFPCADTITLCGKCVGSDVPGNIMFAYGAERYFPNWQRNVGAFLGELFDGDPEIIEEDYDVFPLGQQMSEQGSTDICSVLGRLPQRKVRGDCKSSSTTFSFTTPSFPSYPPYSPGSSTPSPW